MAFIKIVCSFCGGNNVKRDAWAAWNMEKQQWELCDVYDHGHCEDCEGESHLEDVEVTDAYEKAALLAGWRHGGENGMWYDGDEYSTFQEAFTSEGSTIYHTARQVCDDEDLTVEGESEA